MSGRGAGVFAALLVVSVAPAASGDEPPGRGLFEQYCVTCHGQTGKGDGPAGLDLLPMPRDFSVGRFKFDADGDGRTGTSDDLFLVIRDGAAAFGGNPAMVPWASLGDDRIRELVDYIRSLERDASKHGAL